jgi:hypothetical protein
MYDYVPHLHMNFPQRSRNRPEIGSWAYELGVRHPKG